MISEKIEKRRFDKKMLNF